MNLRTHRFSRLSFAVVVFTLNGLQAQSTWDGGGDPDFSWTLSGNWIPDTAPVPSATAALIFDGAVGLTNTNDFAVNAQFNTLTFAAGAGAFSVGGNTIHLGDGTAGTKITNSSGNLQTIGLNLALQQTTVVNTGTAGVTLDGNISGAQGLTLGNFGGGLTLSGDNSHSGPTLITSGNSAGTATIRAIANAGNTSGGVSRVLGNSSSRFEVSTGNAGAAAVLELRANDNTSFATNGVLFGGSVSSSAREFTINVDQAATGNVNKILTLAGTFTMGNYTSGQRTLNVTGGNGYGLAIGALDLTPTGTSTALPRINVSAAGGLTIGSVSGIVSATGLEFTGVGNTTITGNLIRNQTSRDLIITQNGSGSLSLNGVAGTTGASNSTGYVFNLVNGTLNVNNAGALGDGSVAANVSYARTVNLSGGILDNTSGAAITVLNNNSANNGAVRFNVHINGDFAFGGSDALTLNVGSASGQGTQAGLITLGSASGGARTITTNGINALTLNGAIVDGGGATPTASALVKAGSGVLVVEKSNFYTGGTTISGGTLLVNGGAVAARSAVTGTTSTTSTNAANFKITGLDSAVVSNLRAGQAVSGTGIGAGAVVTSILTSTSIMVSQASSAASTVTDLSFSAGGGLGTGPVTISNSGTLGGNGTITGAVTTSSSTSAIAPGNRVGTLSITEGLNAAAGASFLFEIGAASGGSLSDQLVVAGLFTGSSDTGGLIFDFTNIGTAASSPYTLVTFSSSSGLDYTDLFARSVPSNFVLDNSFGTGGFQINADSLQVQFSVIPEPSTVALVLVAGFFAFVLIRHRRD